jgi:hypothetical protein
LIPAVIQKAANIVSRIANTAITERDLTMGTPASWFLPRTYPL